MSDLTYRSGLLVAGRLADLYGRKYLFLFGVTVSLIANVMSGIVPVRSFSPCELI